MKEQGYVKMGWFTEYLVFVVATLGGCAWWWYGAPRKRVTALFLVHRHKIWQSVNHDGRIAMRVQRQQYEGKSLQVKLFGLAKFLRSQMQQLLQALPYDVQFKTRTHLKRSFEKAQQQREITIHSIKKKEKRLLVESIALLGLRDFLKVLFSPNAKLLFKQFYTITFTRTSNVPGFLFEGRKRNVECCSAAWSPDHRPGAENDRERQYGHGLYAGGQPQFCRAERGKTGGFH